MLQSVRVLLILKHVLKPSFATGVTSVVVLGPGPRSWRAAGRWRRWKRAASAGPPVAHRKQACRRAGVQACRSDANRAKADIRKANYRLQTGSLDSAPSVTPERDAFSCSNTESRRSLAQLGGKSLDILAVQRSQIRRHLASNLASWRLQRLDTLLGL